MEGVPGVQVTAQVPGSVMFTVWVQLFVLSVTVTIILPWPAVPAAVRNGVGMPHCTAVAGLPLANRIVIGFPPWVAVTVKVWLVGRASFTVMEKVK